MADAGMVPTVGVRPYLVVPVRSDVSAVELASAVPLTAWKKAPTGTSSLTRTGVAWLP